MPRIEAPDAGTDPEGILDGLSPKLVQEIYVESDGSEEPATSTPQTVETTVGLDDGDGSRYVRREFEPLVVTRLGGTLAWDTDSTQLQCGETVTDSNGDMNLRMVYHCICTQTQFAELQLMRQNPEAVKLVSRAYTGPATFDELKFDRIADANGAIVRGEGTTREPLYEIQLQSKEDESDSTILGEDN